MKVIYTRVSKDPDGTSTSPAAQYEECQTLADRHGWQNVEHLSDVDTSAWRRTVIRPAFQQLLEGIRAGTVDGVVVHHLDRLLRQSRELEALIDAIEATTRGRFAIYSVHGDLDLSTADGRFMARILVSVAQKESDDKSRRLKLVLGEKARQGRPHGGRRPYGWSDDRTSLHPTESVRLREVIDALLAGDSTLNQAAKGLGMRTTTLRQILVNPRLAGLRTHQGQVVAVGEWEPLIDHATHDLLTALLVRPAHENHTTALKHPLSGFLVCGRCGTPMGGRTHRQNGVSTRRYRCRQEIVGSCGTVGIHAAHTEAAVFTVFEALASHVEVVHEEPVGDLERDRAVTTERLEQLARDFYVEQSITEVEYRAAREGLDQRLAELELLGRRQVVDVRPGGEVFAEMPVHQRVDVMKSVVKHVLVAPGVQGRRFDPTRLSIVLRDDVHVPRSTPR